MNKRFLLAAALALSTAVLSGCTASTNDDDGAAPPSTPAPSQAAVSENELEAGQCMTDSGTAAEPNIEVLPCTEEHAFEVFATTELPEGDYPGLGEADALAQEFCRSEFDGFIGVEYDASELDLQYFYPVEEEWATEGGRSVICLVGQPAGASTTGTLKGSAR
ncbi:hypothetical protein GCM10027403_37280 [Arthrobacter tecti]